MFFVFFFFFFLVRLAVSKLFLHTVCRIFDTTTTLTSKTPTGARATQNRRIEKKKCFGNEEIYEERKGERLKRDVTRDETKEGENGKGVGNGKSEKDREGEERERKRKSFPSFVNSF